MTKRQQFKVLEERRNNARAELRREWDELERLEREQHARQQQEAEERFGRNA